MFCCTANYQISFWISSIAQLRRYNVQIFERTSKNEKKERNVFIISKRSGARALLLWKNSNDFERLNGFFQVAHRMMMMSFFVENFTKVFWIFFLRKSLLRNDDGGLTDGHKTMKDRLMIKQTTWMKRCCSGHRNIMTENWNRQY